MSIEEYLKAGVYQEKIVITKQPSVVVWSKSRRCIVGGDSGIEPLEVINDKNGSRISTENNTFVSMLVRTELTKEDVDEINISNGIICTDALYGRKGFRYGFIPN